MSLLDRCCPTSSSQRLQAQGGRVPRAWRHRAGVHAVDPTLPIAPEHTLGFFFLPSELPKAYYFPILVEVFLTSPAEAVVLIHHCLNILAQVSEPEAKPFTLPLSFADLQKSLSNAGQLNRFGPESFRSPGGACFSHSSLPGPGPEICSDCWWPQARGRGGAQIIIPSEPQPSLLSVASKGQL